MGADLTDLFLCGLQIDKSIRAFALIPQQGCRMVQSHEENAVFFKPLAVLRCNTEIRVDQSTCGNSAETEHDFGADQTELFPEPGKAGTLFLRERVPVSGGTAFYHVGDIYVAFPVQTDDLQQHPSTATSYNNIGLSYGNLGDYPKALEYHFKALAIREKVLGKEHPDTAMSYNNIAGVYDSQGDYPKALEYHFKALDIKEKVLGK